MWDKPEIMLWLADLLFALAAILLLYTVLFVLIHLPLFPVREIQVNGRLHHVTRQQVQYIVNRELAGNFFTMD
ncbi:MAG TPA: cell division protein FtsQ, partial [Betaproteobacteria bacterium]|nr:cell division protein FtsQ [Betaproteobacteria bacterium]